MALSHKLWEIVEKSGALLIRMLGPGGTSTACQ